MLDVYRIVLDFSIIAVFILIGVVLRHKIGFFRQFIIPASVIGGLLALALGQNGIDILPVSDMVSKYPVVLVDVLFAGLFVGRFLPGIRQLLKSVGAQAAYTYFNAFGQIAIGMIVVLIFGLVGMTLHPMFGIELILAFQGGPGFSTALAPVFEKFGFAASESTAVGETCAIAGLILAVLIGVILANIGILRNMSHKKHQNKGEKIKSVTFLDESQKRPVGMEITSPETASNLAFNFGFMALAVIGGKLIVMGIIALVPPLKFLPSFPFVLVAGIIIQILLQKTNLTRYIDRTTIESITSFSLDILIVSSLIAVNLSALVTFALPLIIMIILGTLFNLWQALYLAPKILPGSWFEKSITEFGQHTGSVPQSLLLLKMIDPRFETDAAEMLALKLVLFSPIMFPTMIVMLPVLASKGPLFFLAIYLGLMAAILIGCRIICWQKRPAVKWFGS